MNDVNLAAHDNRVDYLGDDATLCMGVATLIQPRGLRLNAFDSLDELSAALDRTMPRVLLLDLRHLSTDTRLPQLIERLIGGTAKPPELICIAEDGGIETRLEAMRAGARAYFSTPIDVADLAKRIISLTGLAKTRQPKILVVEDDPVQANYIALLLNKSGMQPHLVDQPLQILDKMHEVHPDLVLMDLYMPEATGAELTAIIRDTHAFFDIPIIFLSAETDLQKQQDALRVGGDSFIAKPVQRDQLIGAIEHRIRMSRWLKDRRVTADRSAAPSGILLKDEFLRRLDRLVHASEPPAPGAGLILIELDRPQDVLEALGLKGMERLFGQLEGMLAEQLAAEECAARLDDFTFALLAQRDTLEELEALGVRLLGLFAATKLRAGDQRLAITVTIGIGLFTPPADDAITMVSRSRTTLARARHEGGNRVRTWKPLLAPEIGADYEQLVKQVVLTAIAQDGLLLMFQPIVSLGANVGELYEVQLRLRTRDGEEVPAADFLPVAERAGLMPKIDHWVLEHALDVMNARRSTHPRLRLLIHQTIESIATDDWLPWFRDQMIQRNLIRRRPLLQFQMRDIREHRPEARALVEVLRKYGIQVCVANVSGHASDIALLGELSVALAKLSFATLLNTDLAELTQVVEQLRTQGVSVIAAGIEDPATISRVWNCRPDYIQGNSLQMPSSELIYDFHYSTDDM